MTVGDRVHYRACNLCEAICGIEITTKAGEITAIKGDKDDPFSRGHICPKAVALIDIQNDPDRLRGPVKRVGTEWLPIGWDEAFDLVAARIAEIRGAHGNDAIATYQGNPTVHNYGLMTHTGNLFGLLKTRNRFSATSVDQLPHQLVGYWMYGHQLMVPVADIDHTDYMLILGANPIASNGSMMTVPDVGNRLKAIKRRGGKIVVVDPRRTETAQIADEHQFIRPGTDAALLFALLNAIFAENLARYERLAPMLDGLDQVREAISAFTPQAAARITGIEADAIRRIAHEFASAPRAVCYGRVGVSTQRHGTLCQWAIQLINIVTGNLDRVGGALVTKPALDVLTSTLKPGSYARWVSRVRGVPEVAGELPASIMAEEMLSPGEGRIRALLTIAGNPVLSTPNGRQLERALGELDFMASMDFYINETTRFADVILPPTTALERDHYDMAFNVLAVRNVARYNAPVLSRPEGGMHDWEILQSLSDRLAEKLGQTSKPMMAPEQLLEALLQSGPYGGNTQHKLSLQKLKDTPHGIDLGPLAQSFPQRLFTADKRIHCAPAPLLEALKLAEKSLFSHAPGASGGGRLVLIGRRHVRSNNSWMHNFHRLVKGKDRTALFVHPGDMLRLGLVGGEKARLKSRAGELHVEVQASDDMMPGVVCLPHGWGHHRSQTRMRIAAQHPGVSLNDVTDEQSIDVVSGNAVLNGVPVTLEKIA